MQNQEILGHRKAWTHYHHKSVSEFLQDMNSENAEVSTVCTRSNTDRHTPVAWPLSDLIWADLIILCDIQP